MSDTQSDTPDSSVVYLENLTNEPVEVPNKTQGGGTLSISPYSRIIVSQEDFANYDLAPLHKQGKVAQVLPQTDVIVQNKTALRIGIASKTKSDPFVIPPFGKRTLKFQELQDNYDYLRWERLNLIDVKRDQKETSEQDTSTTILIGVLFWVFVLLLVVGGISQFVVGSWVPGVTVIGGISLVGVVIWAYVTKKVEKLLQWVSQVGSLLLVILVGAIVPVFIVYAYSSNTPSIDLRFPQATLPILGRFLQLVLIVIAATLPPLLYYLFDRLRVGTLRENFMRDVLFFDPNLQTLDDAESLYGRLVDEVYGSSVEGRFLSGARTPIVICTILIALGWLLTLMPIGPLQITDPLTLPALFSPQLTPFNLGFLGAYFFGLNLIFRRYVQSDLGPKAYTHVTVRILFAIILVWMLTLIPSQTWESLALAPATPTATPTTTATANATLTVTATPTSTVTAALPAITPTVLPTQTITNTQTTIGASPLPGNAPAGGWDWRLLLVAFIVGIVPETALQILRELPGVVGRMSKSLSFLEAKYPLTDLEGVSLYDRARLLEEGIEDVENLAHHNFIELMLRTRIPTPRLVDLVDQAILYLHVKDAFVARPDTNDNKPTPMEFLRSYGIRTATDLQNAHVATDKEGTKEAFLSLLDEANDKVKRLTIILKAIEDDEWMSYIECWRETHTTVSKTVYELDHFVKSQSDAD